jgi:hypothetical protein
LLHYQEDLVVEVDQQGLGPTFIWEQQVFILKDILEETETLLHLIEVVAVVVQVLSEMLV